MARREPAQQRRQQVRGDGRARADPERSQLEVPEGAHVRFGGPGQAEDDPRVLGEHRAGLGEPRAAGAPLQQGHGEPAFQLAHRLADRRLAHVDGLRGAGEAAVPGDGLEQPEGIEAECHNQKLALLAQTCIGAMA